MPETPMPIVWVESVDAATTRVQQLERLTCRADERWTIESLLFKASADVTAVTLQVRDEQGDTVETLRVYDIRKAESVSAAYFDGDGNRGYRLPALRQMSVLLRVESSAAVDVRAVLQLSKERLR